MGRLIVVSNRVAIPGNAAPGGLAVGVLAALREGGVWFGWSGNTGDSSGEHDVRERDGIRFVTTDLPRAKLPASLTHLVHRS